MMVVHTLRVRVDRVRLPASRQDFVRAHSKMVLRGIRIAEAGVRFSLGPNQSDILLVIYSVL